MDPDFGLCEQLPVNSLLNPSLFKVKDTADPDTPTYMEAMISPHKEQFLEAMQKEIE